MTLFEAQKLLLSCNARIVSCTVNGDTTLVVSVILDLSCLPTVVSVKSFALCSCVKKVQELIGDASISNYS